MADDSKELISALQSALQEFDGVKVESLIQQGLDIRNVHVDRQNHNAIHELVLNYTQLQSTEKHHMKFVDTLNVLVGNQMDINEGNVKGQTALHIAASSPGNAEMVRVLLAHGARLNQPDSGQQTALHKAVLHGNVEEVTVLLERGADPNFVDNVGHSPIHLAVKSRSTVSCRLPPVPDVYTERTATRKFYLPWQIHKPTTLTISTKFLWNLSSTSK